MFDIPNYNFNWQDSYHLAQPKFVPKGTRAIFKSVWDNSEANPFNPDPDVTVESGYRSEDEMWVMSLHYEDPEDGGVHIRIEDGRFVGVVK